MSNHEYPFWGRWQINGINASDITSVNYVLQKWNKSTNVFDVIGSGTIGSADARGRWIVPYTLPDSSDIEAYEAILTAVGGNYADIIDSIGTITTPITTSSGSGSEPFIGCGSENHSSRVVDPDGNPLEGVTVEASPYGTNFVFSSTTTNSLGLYTISGLHAGHAYQISYNLSGYFGKVSEIVIA